MVEAKNILVINQLIDYWISKKIRISTKSKEEINKIDRERKLQLPNDFKEFYIRVNGMEDLYPNEIDEEGFLFYPIEAIVSMSTEFKKFNFFKTDKIFIFAEFMHKSWWYGFQLNEKNEYMIGIIPDSLSFKPITNSLTEFLELYLIDSPILYDYS
jgi:SMI1-KNR4 cell-wall